MYKIYVKFITEMMCRNICHSREGGNPVKIKRVKYKELGE
jgi:hypothetical protein